MSGFYDKLVAKQPPVYRAALRPDPGSPWWSYPQAQPAQPEPQQYQQQFSPQKQVSASLPARLSQPCPNACGGYLFQPDEMIKPRCFDCGYPYLQSGSGQSAVTRGKPKPARQVNTEGSWAPGSDKHIVAHLG